MPDNNKHKIFSKEELFKLLDEKRSLPPEADDFDKEAMEGLSMLTDRKKLDGLNNSIDEVLRKEKMKARKRKNLYFLSAAASLLLVIGLFFLLKDASFDKKENELAENTKVVNDISPPDQTKVLEESPAEEKKLAKETVNSPAATATGETSENLEKTRELGLAKSKESVSAGGDAVTMAPTEVAANIQTKAEERKQTAEDEATVKADRDDVSGGKDYKTSLAKDDQWKKDELKKSELKLEDKEKEKDKKTRYETNTVWVTPSSPSKSAGGSTGESKSKTEDLRNKNQDSKDGNFAAGVSGNVAASEKNAEIAVSGKQSSKGPDRKSNAIKQPAAKPDSIVTDMLAGYSYYDQKPDKDKGIVQGGEPQKVMQTTTPVQTQNEIVTTPNSVALKESADVPAEQKLAQEESNKKATRHEAQLDNTTIADIQNAEPKSVSRGNATLESAEFNGGKEALQQYVKKNLKISSPKKTGTIIAEFVVTKEGKIDTGTVKITTKIKNCDPCSKDVKDLVKTMPKLKPATENGRAMERKQKMSIDYNSEKAK